MIAQFARHKTAANLLMIGLAAIGILTISELRRETFPDFSSDEVEVRVIYPGASAEEIEEAICQRLEDALDGVRNVAEIRSDARESMGVVTVQMNEGEDFATFKDDVNTEVEAISDFPTDAEDPVVRELGTTDMVMVLLVTGDMSPTHLKAYCEELKDRLLQLPELSLIEVAGFSDHQLRVEIRPEILQGLSLSVADVADRIARQSVDLPAGVLETGERDILLRFQEQRQTPVELEQLVVVEGAEGAVVRLGDIGNVVDLFESAEEKVTLGGRRAGRLLIQKTKTEDTIRIAHAVKTFLAEEAERQPPGVEVVVTQDMSTLTQDRIQLLVKNAWQGLILVFLVMWLFFNLRLSFWVAAGLPISFLGAFYFMPGLDLTINMLTMVGLLLALGLLMDDAIVIAENVATHWQSGKPAVQAAIDGTSEVKWGVVSSFATTVCVLGPLIGLEGDIGKVLRVVPMILILVLAVSLIEAFFILPAHLGHSLAKVDRAKINPFRRRFDGALEWVREKVLGRTVDHLLAWRYLTFGMVVAAFLLSIGLVAGGFVKFQPFPDLEGDVVVARLLQPQGTPLERTEAVVARLEAGLQAVNETWSPRQPDGKPLIETVSVEFAMNADAFEAGAHVATITANLLSAEEREGRIDDFLAQWREEVGEVADVLSLVYTEPSFGPAGRPIEIRFTGDDLEQLQAASGRALTWFEGYVGVLDLADDLRPGKEELRVRLKPGTLGLGLDVAGLARQLRAGFQGVTADEIQVGPEAYEIDVRLHPDARNSIADLERFHFTLPNGTQVPLGSVAEIEHGRSWARIARFDRQRAVTLRGNVDSRLVNVAELIAAFQKEVAPELESEFPGVHVAIAGESEEGGKTRASMLAAMLTGLLGVFILLSFQFQSYTEPLIVMVAIPFALIGVIWVHLLLGLDLSMPSGLGFVSLAGIVVNDSILMVLFLKEARRQGRDVIEAAGEASRARFRAVTLTSATTVAGILPLLSERSLQAQVLIPLAASIVGGILMSTILVLLVLPCLYAILGDLGLVSRLKDEDH